MRICNVYSYDLPSVGDQNCAPMQYFGFPCLVDRKTAVDPTYDYIIFGGGGHIHIPSPTYNDGRFGHLEAILPYAKKIIMWGVGHNVYESKKIEYPEYMDDFLIGGYRDVQRKDWVPCPSCMNEAFDTKYRAMEKCRIFFKKHLPISGPWNSLQDSGELNVDQVARFLGGAATIITNSYHAAYWSLLLDREVIVKNPHSTKFYGLLDEFEEKDGDLYLPPPPGYLRKCRRSNVDFHAKVIELIEGEM